MENVTQPMFWFLKNNMKLSFYNMEIIVSFYDMKIIISFYNMEMIISFYNMVLLLLQQIRELTSLQIYIFFF